jgi:hypothetical protein
MGMKLARFSDARRVANEEFAARISREVAVAGFFGADAAMDAIRDVRSWEHTRGDHEGWWAPDCPACSEMRI